MDRRTFLAGTGAVLLPAPLVAEAQQAGKVPIVGAFSVPPVYRAAFAEGLREYGYTPGRNIIIEYRGSGMTEERRAEAVAELVRLNVAVIVTGPNTFIDQARRATSTIPIVMVYAADPVGQKYVASLARPGGNITGLAWDAAPAIGGKWVELLTQLRPRPTRIAGIREPWYGNDVYQKEAEFAAKIHAITLTYVDVRGADDLPEAFTFIASAHTDAIIVFRGPTLWGIRSQISDLARKSGLPTMYVYRDGPDAGGLMSYGPNLRESWRRAATYVDKIPKGAKPADLPVEQPTTFELVINLKTAKALGLTIPPSLLGRADEVIE